MNGGGDCSTAPATPGLLNRLCHSDKELSKSQRESKLHHWFKSYGHFSGGVDFAHCIGGVASGRVCVCSLRSRLVFYMKQKNEGYEKKEICSFNFFSRKLTANSVRI